MPRGWTPRKDMTPEQRQAHNNKQRDNYNERRATELLGQIDLEDVGLSAKDSENAALRSAIKTSKGGAGSRKTPEGAIKKTAQQSGGQAHGGERRRDNPNQG